jgi:hypothetical protein
MSSALYNNVHENSITVTAVPTRFSGFKLQASSFKLQASSFKHKLLETRFLLALPPDYIFRKTELILVINDRTNQ